mgnify:CR=1 FL=1
MNKIPNRQAICEVLMEKAETDKDIVVLCSDSRGSASLAPCGAGFGQHFRRACQMREKTVCGFSCLLPFHKKL